VADPRDRWPENTAVEVTLGGRRVSFYVDRQCIACRVCTDAAPSCFACTEDEDHDYVARQPQTLEELAACDDAKANCPVEAIGDDGWSI